MLKKRAVLAEEQERYLDVGNWRSFMAASSLESYCQSWLEILCLSVAGLASAVVVWRRGNDFAVVSRWPAELVEAPLPLRDVIERSLEDVQAVVSGDETGHRFMAFPLDQDGEAMGSVALELSGEGDEHAAMRAIQLSVGWLYAMPWLNDGSGESQEFPILPLLASVTSHGGYRKCADALVAQLAIALDCTRVAFARLMERRGPRVEAVSFQSDLDRKSPLLQDMEMVMEEILAEGVDTIWSENADGAEGLVFHNQYATRHEVGALLGVLMLKGETPWGVLLLERRGQPFSVRERSFCDALARVIAPWLDALARDERPLRVILRERMGRLAGGLTRSGHWTVKAILAGTVAAILCLILVQGDYRVQGRALLEGEVQRVIVAPFDGYVHEAFVRAGDSVGKGEPLARMDDRNLKLEESKWQAKLSEARDDYRKALAEHDKVQVRLGQARIRQAEAELRLVRMKLERLTLRSPFDGVVVKGDLSQSLGSPKRKGERLFTLAPLDRYRVAVFVPEVDVDDIHPRMPGALRLTAMPGQVWPVRLERITPIAKVRDGVNTFRIEASIRPGIGRDVFRPGMKGVCKFDVGRRSIGWIWFHHFWQWLRLKVWEWMP